jgi:hypothetical protein
VPEEEASMPTKRALSAVLALLLAVSFAAPSGARATASDDGFEYFVTGSTATVTACVTTCSATLVIPATLGGYSVTSIGVAAFASNNLTTASIPNSVTTIGGYAFYNNSVTSVTIGNSVTTIGASAFSNNALTTLTIGNSVTTIGNQSFYDNTIETLTIPASVTLIDFEAFAFNSLTSVTFLGNAPTDGGDVFRINNSLTSVTRPYAASGWGVTWAYQPVVIADTQATPTVKPKVTGTAKVAKTLTAAKGTWIGSPEPTFTYQWYACTKAVSAAIPTIPPSKKCTKITGATGSSFKLKSKQRGKYVAVLVTGTSLGTTATTWLSKTTTKVK